jgi:hypothetical protein
MHVGAVLLVVQAIDAGQRAVDGVLRQRLVRLDVVLQVVDRRLAGRLAEHQQVEQGIGAEAVGAMHRSAGALAGGVEAQHRLALVAALGDHDLAQVVGRNAAHLVVAGRHHRQRFLEAIDAGELDADLMDAGQSLHDGLGRQVGDVEQHEILVRPAAAAFVDLGGHGARNHVARGEILGIRRIALHEPLAVRVAQDAALAAHAFGDQHAGTGDAGRVELPELHVFEGDAGTRRHADAIAGIDEGIGRRVVDAPRAAGGENGRLGVEDDDLAGFHVHRRDAHDVALGIAHQVQRLPFDEELGIHLDVALVHRVQHGVAGAVGRSAGTAHRLLAEVRHVAAERALVDLAVVEAVEGHAVMLEFDHDFVGLAAHELDRVLVAEPVGALDGVVHVPVPVILLGVAQAGGDAALSGHGMRARREDLGQHGGLVAGFGELDRGTQAGAAGADDDRIEFANGVIHSHSLQMICMAQPA